MTIDDYPKEMIEKYPIEIIEKYEKKANPVAILLSLVYAIACFIAPILTIAYPTTKAELGYSFYEAIDIYGRATFGQIGSPNKDHYAYTAADGFSPIIKPFIIIAVISNVVGFALMGDIGEISTKKWTIIHLIGKGVTMIVSIIGIIAMIKFTQFIKQIDQGYNIYKFTITYWMLLVEFSGGIIVGMGGGILEIIHIAKKDYLPMTKRKWFTMKGKIKRKEEEEKEGGKKEEEKIEERGKEKKLILKRKEK
jgi:hypothetical protein